jgi:hypothetical protein
MKRPKPSGGDMPPNFIARKQFTEKPSAALRKANVDIARHNLQVKVAWFKRETFRVAKQVALEGDKEATRDMDKYVRSAFKDDRRIMAEWEELMSRCGFTDDVLE